MKTNFMKKLVSLVLVGLMIFSILPTSVFAATASDLQTSFEEVSQSYYNVISSKEHVLVPGAATETEIVINNDEGSRRQVLHVVEVDPSNPDVSIVPGYYGIDKDLTDISNQQAAKLTDMADYYENQLGYNVVAGMNTDLTYASNAPRVLVYNGQDLRIGSATSSVLCVYKDADGNISCDVKAYNKAEIDAALADGSLLHAVGVSFSMVVKDGDLVSKTVKRGTDDAARSMVGVKEDGTLVLCMNDGRSANNSVGLSSYEEGEVMLSLGCKWAANCDGGGSSTFISKRVGEEEYTMRSVPCDGAERPTLHGVFITSNVAPTGVLNNVEIKSGYDYFAPNTVYTFDAEAIDTHGYAMDMPADVTWALSDASFGTIVNGKFTSNGTMGDVDIQVISGGQVVGAKTIYIANPTTLALSATSTVVPYSTADRVRNITLPIVAMIGEENVYFDTNAIKVTLSNEKAGTLDGFKFTATTDTSVLGTEIIATYLPTNATLTYTVEFGKGSEVIFDFEDGNVSDWMGFDEAKQWSIDNGVNNSLISSSPLDGQFSEEVDGKTFLSTTENGGQVRNGKNALAWSIDNTDASFAGWTYSVLFNTGESVVLRDVKNGKLATKLGFWLYIPEGATGLAFQSQLFTKNADGSYSHKQDHFTFTTKNGTVKNLNSCTEADIPESRWVYASIDISKYDYLCTPVATDTSSLRSPSIIRTYVKPTAPAVHTFYIDDITLDYSSAVDDRVLPTINDISYATNDTAITLAEGAKVNGNTMAFTATVADETELDTTSAKMYVDGVVVNTTLSGKTLASEDITLTSGVHTLAIEVKDAMGNPSKVTRTFTVEGDAVVTLTGHNDSGALAEYDSVYYMDVNVADLASVNKLATTLKLHNSNTWEPQGMVVAEGFTASYSYNDISELLTVTVEANGEKIAENTNTIISIPVRLWSWNTYNHITGNVITPEAQFATGYCPIVTIDCDVVSGEIEFAGVAYDGYLGVFGGTYSVDTNLNDNVNPWHYHDVELTTLNADATCAQAGYTDRTYCETCASVIDWGTTIEATGHNYTITDGVLKCECGVTFTGVWTDGKEYVDGIVIADGWVGDSYYVNGEKITGIQLVEGAYYNFDENGVCEGKQKYTGLFEADGNTYYALVGNLVNGWQYVDGNYYYFNTTTNVAVDGKVTIGGYKYEFENNVLVEGQIVKDAHGSIYMWAGKAHPAGWFTVKGKTYLSLPNKVLAMGRTKFMPSTNSATYICDFDENGVLISDKLNGVVEYNGNNYYVKDSVVQYGTYEYKGDIYYFRSSGIAATGKYNISADKTNGLLEAGYYVFDEAGKLLKDGWSTAWDGKERHIVNGKPDYTLGVIAVAGDTYYVRSDGSKATGKYNVAADKTNGILEAGYYVFDEDGKLIKDGWSTAWDGKERHIVNGKPDYTLGVITVAGDIFYIRSSGVKATGKYNVAADKTNGILEAGYHVFDTDGKLIKDGWSTAWDGKERHIVNGKPDYTLGVITVAGDIFYIRSSGVKATGKYNVAADKTNGILEAGYHVFDTDGKLIKDGWSIAWDGKERHIVNGKPDYTLGAIVVNGDIYYIRSNGAKATGRYFVSADKTNGILESKYYNFGEDGKLIG